MGKLMQKKLDWLIKYYSSIPSRKLIDLIRDERVKDRDKHAMKIILKKRGEENSKKKKSNRASNRALARSNLYRVGNMRTKIVQGGRVSPR